MIYKKIEQRQRPERPEKTRHDDRISANLSMAVEHELLYKEEQAKNQAQAKQGNKVKTKPAQA